jgi:hypothetical protein
MGTCCRDNSGGPAGPPDTRTPIREGEGRQAATGCAVARTNHRTLVISCSGKGNLVHTQPVVIDHTHQVTNSPGIISCQLGSMCGNHRTLVGTLVVDYHKRKRENKIQRLNISDETPDIRVTWF